MAIISYFDLFSLEILCTMLQFLLPVHLKKNTLQYSIWWSEIMAPMRIKYLKIEHNWWQAICSVSIKRPISDPVSPKLIKAEWFLFFFAYYFF